MARAIWNDVVIAESDATVRIEGNHYFPAASVKREYLHPGDTRTYCPWKGEASYYDVEVDGKRGTAAAWHYPDPKEKAREIKDYVAFWKGVRVED